MTGVGGRSQPMGFSPVPGPLGWNRPSRAMPCCAVLRGAVLRRGQGGPGGPRGSSPRVATQSGLDWLEVGGRWGSGGNPRAGGLGKGGEEGWLSWFPQPQPITDLPSRYLGFQVTAASWADTKGPSPSVPLHPRPPLLGPLLNPHCPPDATSFPTTGAAHHARITVPQRQHHHCYILAPLCSWICSRLNSWAPPP